MHLSNIVHLLGTAGDVRGVQKDDDWDSFSLSFVCVVCFAVRVLRTLLVHHTCSRIVIHRYVSFFFRPKKMLVGLDVAIVIQ